MKERGGEGRTEYPTFLSGGGSQPRAPFFCVVWFGRPKTYSVFQLALAGPGPTIDLLAVRRWQGDFSGRLGAGRGTGGAQPRSTSVESVRPRVLP